MKTIHVNIKQMPLIEATNANGRKRPPALESESEVRRGGERGETELE